MDISKELELLLKNFWIKKETNREEYYQIKSKLKPIREFVNNKLGSDIIVNSDRIKLEKIPSSINSYQGIKEFDDALDYVLFLIIISFLEEKGKQDQFILSNLTDYIKNYIVTISSDYKIDWNTYKQRKSLVDVLNYITSLGIIIKCDGNEFGFADNEKNEVLYENTSLSHYIVRNFKQDITTFTKPQDFLEEDSLLSIEEASKKRYTCYRELLYNPVVYFENLESGTVDYLINYRNRIKKDLEELTGANLQIYKNMAFLSYPNTQSKNSFPNNQVLSDIVLLVNYQLKQLEKPRNNLDEIEISMIEFSKLVEEIHEEYKNYFSKEFREMNFHKLLSLLIDFMSSYGFLTTKEKTIQIKPLTALINGKYPKKIEEEINPFTQIEWEV